MVGQAQLAGDRDDAVPAKELNLSAASSRTSRLGILGLYGDMTGDDGAATGSDQSLAGAHVSTAGTVSTNWSDGFTLVPGLDSIDFPKYPALGARGGGAFLVWLHQQPNPSTATSLQGGARVSRRRPQEGRRRCGGSE